MDISSLITAILLSISPLGEARVGIPYGVFAGNSVLISFIAGLSANLLVFPLFYFLINWANKKLWKHKGYKKSAVYLGQRAKRKTGSAIGKYGAWGLMVFVMIPLPVTGAYVGTIAAYVLGIPYKKSLASISVGVTISSAIIAFGLQFGQSLW